MRAADRRPACQGTGIRAYPGLRARDGPSSIGDIAADAFTKVSQFSAYAGQSCGHTELHRNRG